MRVEELPVPSLVAAQTSSERNPPKSKGNDDLLPRGFFYRFVIELQTLKKKTLSRGKNNSATVKISLESFV
jgi:hypothetical protein